MISLSIILPPVRTAASEFASGIVEIAGADVFPLFRCNGSATRTIKLRRIRQAGGTEWVWITDPTEGVTASPADILITQAEAERFEREHGLFANGTRDGSHGDHKKTRRPAGPGAPARYEWDAFYAAIVRRVHEHGIPKTQAELIREMLDWFEQRHDEHAPDESTVRRKVAVVWRELNRA
jgi:hypothetical protein